MGLVLRCKAKCADSTPCESPSKLINPENGLCRSHDPSLREAIKAAGRKGGAATARRFKSTGMDEADLPPLTSPEVAEIWLERIARCVATGGLPHQDARAATSALQQWLKAHEVGKLVDRLETLREQLQSVKAAR